MDHMPYRIGLGHDTHRLGPGRALKLGGVSIPHETGLVGHSDADVLLHAVTDAILGACGRGDIGEWFPNDAEINKDRDSAELLREVLQRAMPPGAKIVNVDCIVFAEAPKLSPHKGAIRSRLADLLGIPPDRVGVKAKTGESVGPIGRREAMSAEAVVLVEWPEG
jgi:2-C-methyl-D-erythritol 2,4-cyclodiphosphate synthase